MPFQLRMISVRMKFRRESLCAMVNWFELEGNLCGGVKDDFNNKNEQWRRNPFVTNSDKFGKCPIKEVKSCRLPCRWCNWMCTWYIWCDLTRSISHVILDMGLNSKQRNETALSLQEKANKNLQSSRTMQRRKGPSWGSFIYVCLVRNRLCSRFQFNSIPHDYLCGLTIVKLTSTLISWPQSSGNAEVRGVSQNSTYMFIYKKIITVFGRNAIKEISDDFVLSSMFRLWME